MLVVKTLRQARITTIQTSATEGSDRVPVKAVKTPAPLLVRSLFLFFFSFSNRSGGRGRYTSYEVWVDNIHTQRKRCFFILVLKSIDFIAHRVDQQKTATTKKEQRTQ